MSQLFEGSSKRGDLPSRIFYELQGQTTNQVCKQNVFVFSFSNLKFILKRKNSAKSFFAYGNCFSILNISD